MRAQRSCDLSAMRLARCPVSLTFLLLMVLTSLLTAAFAEEACPAHDLPAPTGKYAVGTTVLPVEKLQSTRTSRRVQLWYPAISKSAGQPAAYVPDPDIVRVLRAEQFLNLPDCIFDAWRSMKLAARMDAPIAQLGRLPLVMIAPGAGMSRISYSYYAQQLASDGYIVATVDFSEGGFLVRDGKRVQEAPDAADEAGFGKQAQHMAAHMSDLGNELLTNPADLKLPLVRGIATHIDPTRIAAIGHSLGGAAALDLCMADQRVRGCVDLDGIAGTPVAEQGITTSTLMLRSQPDYSDADLLRLHRDPAQWKAKGEAISAETAKLLAHPGPDAWIVSIHGTGHMSYSDAPITMPGTLTQFGGTYLDARRVLSITTEIIEGYLLHVFANRAFSVAQFPEATVQTSRNQRPPAK